MRFIIAKIFGALLLVYVVAGCVEPHIEKRKVTSFDGAELDVWVMPAENVPPKDRGSVKTLVIFHPWLANKFWFYDIAKDMSRRGWNVVLFDQRNHGLSSKMPTTWGAKEKKDAKIIVDHMLAEGLISEELYAFGASMGGCHAVQYAAIDPRVRGCFAVVPVSGLRGAKRQAMPLASEEAVEKMVQEEARVNGYDPDEADAIAAVAQLKCPLIVVGGSLDVVVPKEQCRAIYDAAPEPKDYILLMAGHHFAQKGRDDWLVKQILRLPEMTNQPVSAPAE